MLKNDDILYLRQNTLIQAQFHLNSCAVKKTMATCSCSGCQSINQTINPAVVGLMCRKQPCQCNLCDMIITFNSNLRMKVCQQNVPNIEDISQFPSLPPPPSSNISQFPSLPPPPSTIAIPANQFSVLQIIEVPNFESGTVFETVEAQLPPGSEEELLNAPVLTFEDRENSLSIGAQRQLLNGPIISNGETQEIGKIGQNVPMENNENGPMENRPMEKVENGPMENGPMEKVENGPMENGPMENEHTLCSNLGKITSKGVLPKPFLEEPLPQKSFQQDQKRSFHFDNTLKRKPILPPTPKRVTDVKRKRLFSDHENIPESCDLSPWDLSQNEPTLSTWSQPMDTDLSPEKSKQNLDDEECKLLISFFVFILQSSFYYVSP